MTLEASTLDFIRCHREDDVRQLALRGSRLAGVDLSMALQQIAGWQTARRKLPSWAACEGLLYPPRLSMEQCSSEATARYKAGVLAALALPAATLVDLTGGFGVDFSFLAAKAVRAVYVERNMELCGLARHNFRLLGLTQASVVCAEAADYLSSMSPVDVVFMDPARRDAHGGRTYALGDCSPDVLQLRPLLRQKARNVLLKLSPMLDWQKTVSDLGTEWVRQVHVVSVSGECKELLVLLGEGEGLRLCCVNDGNVFEASGADSVSVFSGVSAGQWLCEPNASVMKAGCFGTLARRFALAGVGPHSHLFVSDGPVEAFPGRCFRVEGVSTLNKRDLRGLLQGLDRANITVRNFPLSVADLRRRLKLSEGGDVYLFATTLSDGSHVLVRCKK